MDDIFKALGDPTRRAILDLLRRQDGQTVSQIEAACPDMTRFGVMKHLAVLEEAGLIASRRQGRFRYLHLNVAPLQQVMDRWVDPLLRPWARRLEDLRTRLEQDTAMTDQTATLPAFRMETWIRTTPERLWAALTDPRDTANYYFGTAVRSGWKAGDAIDYLAPDGTAILGGSVISADPPRRLVTSFQPHWGGQPGRITRVTYEIEAHDGACRLTLIHDGLTEADGGIREGWGKILAGLKTWLETGTPLPLPMG
jgi:DNA-binding transcriptional ArsR family regulator/uncharacterized protein YndB with AHSA1/START domain